MSGGPGKSDDEGQRRVQVERPAQTGTAHTRSGKDGRALATGAAAERAQHRRLLRDVLLDRRQVDRDERIGVGVLRTSTSSVTAHRRNGTGETRLDRECESRLGSTKERNLLLLLDRLGVLVLGLALGRLVVGVFVVRVEREARSDALLGLLFDLELDAAPFVALDAATDRARDVRRLVGEDGGLALLRRARWTGRGGLLLRCREVVFVLVCIVDVGRRLGSLLRRRLGRRRRLGDLRSRRAARLALGRLVRLLLVVLRFRLGGGDGDVFEVLFRRTEWLVYIDRRRRRLLDDSLLCALVSVRGGLDRAAAAV